MTQNVELGGTVGENRGQLVRISGAMGIASCFIGLAIFLAICAGLNAVLVLSIVPLLLSGPGFVMSIIGGWLDRSLGVQDTPVVAAFFVNVMGVIGSLLLVALWLDWPLFARPAAM